MHGAEHAAEHAEAIPASVLIAISVVVGLTGILIAYLVHMKKIIDPEKLIKKDLVYS